MYLVSLRTVIPCLYAKPLLGLICNSQPSGNSKNKPVGTNFLSKGFNEPLSFALKSKPESPSLA